MVVWICRWVCLCYWWLAAGLLLGGEASYQIFIDAEGGGMPVSLDVQADYLVDTEGRIRRVNLVGWVGIGGWGPDVTCTGYARVNDQDVTFDACHEPVSWSTMEAVILGPGYEHFQPVPFFEYDCLVEYYRNDEFVRADDAQCGFECCLAADMNLDGYVDLRDVAELQNAQQR
jgi:hypothetical protein